MEKPWGMFDLGYWHGANSGSACPTRIGNPEYLRGFTAGWKVWSSK